MISVFENIFMETGIPFVFIIDEWDCVLRYYSSESEQKKYLDYLYALFKGQPYVALAYMTGILPIKKYGVHSALNMFNEYSMEGAYPFSEFTGFTEQETEELFKNFEKAKFLPLPDLILFLMFHYILYQLIDSFHIFCLYYILIFYYSYYQSSRQLIVYAPPSILYCSKIS